MADEDQGSIVPVRYVERVFPTSEYVQVWMAPVPGLTAEEHQIAMGVYYYFHELYRVEREGVRWVDPDAENGSWRTPVEISVSIGALLALLVGLTL